MLKTQSNLPPPPLAIDVAPAGESCHLGGGQLESGQWAMEEVPPLATDAAGYLLPTQPHSGKPRRRVEAGTCISAMQRRLGIWKCCQKEQSGRVLAAVAVVVVVQGPSNCSQSGRCRWLEFRGGVIADAAPRLPSSDTVSTWTPDWRIAGNDKGPFCHFCRAGDGRTLEFPFHGITESHKVLLQSPAMRQLVSAPKPGNKSRLNVMRILKDACREVILVNFDIICLIPSAHQGLDLFETFLPGLPVSSGVRPAAHTIWTKLSWTLPFLTIS